MDRRTLLQGLAAAPLASLAVGDAGAAPRASRDAIVTDLDIFQVRVNKRGNWVIIRLRTQSGLTGIGEASHGGNDARTIDYLKQLAGLLRGRSIFDVEWFRGQAAKQVAQSGGLARSAASALEQCLWDLIGKVTGQPVHHLLGGALYARIDLYANINRSADPRTPDGFAAMARRAVDAGFDAIKLAPFDEMPKAPSDAADIGSGLAHGLACAQAVRDAIGPARQLMIDVHSRLTVKQGLAALPRFAPLDLYWLEEVTAEEGFADLATINRAARMTTAGGEALYGIEAFYRYAQSGAVDIVMPDVKLCGGILELKKISVIAEAAGLKVSPHGPAGPVGTIAAAHVMVTVPNFTKLEFAFGEVPWRAELLEPAEDVSGGALTLSSRPGFGVELNDRALAKYAV
jgi:galactonate dehydratase